MNRTISIIIPTFNECDNIVPLVERLHNNLSKYNYEIIFIDDNSRDGTADLASTLSDKYPVKVVVRQNKRGLASAVVDGLGYANGDVVGVMDADLQHPPETIPDLLKEIENGADLVIASRYVNGGACAGWGLTRRIMSKGAIFLAHLLLPSTREISDPMSGFFMLKKETVANADLKPTGYKILLEVLIEGQFQKIAEVPYTFRVRSCGESKLGARQQIDYLKHLYSLMRRKGEFTRFFKFCLVGTSGVLVNEGLLWILRQFTGLPLLLSSAISIEASIISNFMLNNFFTFRDRRLPGVLSFVKRVGKYNTVCLGGLAINMGVLWFLTNALGIHYLLSNLVGIALATFWNYLANTWWTWK